LISLLERPTRPSELGLRFAHHPIKSSSQKMEDELALVGPDVARLRRIIAQIDEVIGEAGKVVRKQRNSRGSSKRASKRVRRTGRDLLQFRKALKLERKRGVPVTAIARKYGVSAAYIYQLA
jgi:hypothetical protein